MSIPIVQPDWPAPASIFAGTTTRAGGISRGAYASMNLGERCGDEPAAVAENRQRFADTLDAEPAWLHQCHGTGALPASRVDEHATADACFTNGPGKACVVLTADCLPVLLCEQYGAAVAAIHAGWRGLAAGVIESCLRSMGTDTARLLAWLGPAISQPHFEVGEEVRAAFVEGHAQDTRHFARNSRGRWQADLAGLAAARLRRAGIERVFKSGLCTYAHARRFYSYRRDGVTGRMASFIVIR